MITIDKTSEKHIPEEKNSRRKIITSIGLLGLFPILKFGFSNKKKDIISCAPESAIPKLRMLTQDGLLVEVDASKIVGTKQKISNEQLQSWVKKDL